MQGSLVASGKWVKMISETSKTKDSIIKIELLLNVLSEEPKLVGYVGAYYVKLGTVAGKLDYMLNGCKYGSNQVIFAY